MVFQETSGGGAEPVPGAGVLFNRLRGIYIAAQQFLQSLNFDVDPTATVDSRGGAKKQMAEIGRAVW